MIVTKHNFLFLSDNDGTLFNTFEPSPTGYGVNEAYSQALLDILGPKALNIFNKSGLKNRAPGQVIDLILTESNGEMGDLFENVKLFFNKDEAYKLHDLVPQGKGHEIELNYENPRPMLTELLVRVKLSYLMGNIGAKNPDGTLWPRMFPGVKDFLDTLKDYADFGIISSGHDLFIKKSFEVHEMECPDLMVTDDDVRGLSFENKSLISKPSPYLIHRALRQWGYGDKPPCECIVYTGDDIEKDGQMAKNAGVPFIHFDEHNTNHWYELKQALLEKKLFL